MHANSLFFAILVPVLKTLFLLGLKALELISVRLYEPQNFVVLGKCTSHHVFRSEDFINKIHNTHQSSYIGPLMLQQNKSENKL